MFYVYSDGIHTHTLSHTEAFTHRHFYTEAFTHRHFYTQTLLHTAAFTHRRFCDRTREITILLQFLAIEPHFAQKGCPDPTNRNFTAVFGD